MGFYCINEILFSIQYVTFIVVINVSVFYGKERCSNLFPYVPENVKSKAIGAKK